MSRAKNPSIAVLKRATGAERIGYNSETVAKALGNRAENVETVASLKTLDLQPGKRVFLTENGREGAFVVKSGAAPSDPENGVFVPLNNGNYAQRVGFTHVTPDMFGGRTETAIQAAFNSGFPVDLGGITDYQLSGPVTLNDGQVIKANGAVFTRAAGAGAFDMVSGTDVEVHITGWWKCDGNKDADALVKENASDRFAGFRFIRCTGQVEKLRADNTVNGEIQAEGIRAGIVFESCTDELKAFHLRGKGNDGTAVFPYKCAMTCAHVYTSNNAGSGFTSYGCDDAKFYDIESVVSGYSGVSINGNRCQAHNLRGFGAASGYANVNIGHDNNGNRADDAIVSGVVSRAANGWGVTVVGSSRCRVSGIFSEGSASNNVYVFGNSDQVTLAGVIAKNAGGNGILFRGGKGHSVINANVSGGAIHGVQAFDGAEVTIDETSRIYNNGSDLLGFTAGVLAEGAGTIVTFKGKAVDGLEYGVSASNNGLLKVLGATVRNNAAGGLRASNGGVVEEQGVRISDDPMGGEFTASAGTVTTVTNANVRSIRQIDIRPLDGSAAALNWFVSSVAPGVSFNVTFTTSAAGTENFAYKLN